MKSTATVPNPYPSLDLIETLKRHNIEALVSVPEVKALLTDLVELKDQRQRIAESMNVLPAAEISKLFNDFIMRDFEGCLQEMFDSLHDGLMKIIANTFLRHLEEQNRKMDEMKSMILMVGLNPMGWMEVELVRDIRTYLDSSPGRQATLFKIYQHLAHEKQRPIPGYQRVDKQEFLINLMRHQEGLREHHGFVFELVKTEIVDDGEQYGGSSSYRSVLRESICEMGASNATKIPKSSKKARRAKVDSV